MTSIFIIINLIIGIITIYLEIKNRERNDKIFYTFYMVGLGIIITPFLGIIDNLLVNIIFTLLYSILLYGIYSDFEFLTIAKEFLLTIKDIKKEEVNKIDYEFIKIIKNAIKDLNDNFSIKLYKLSELIIDEILIGVGVILVGIFSILLIYK